MLDLARAQGVAGPPMLVRSPTTPCRNSGSTDRLSFSQWTNQHTGASRDRQARVPGGHDDPEPRSDRHVHRHRRHRLRVRRDVAAGVLTAARPPVDHAVTASAPRRHHPDRDPRLGRAQQRRRHPGRVRRVRAPLRHPARLAQGLGAEHARHDGGVPPRRGARPAPRTNDFERWAEPADDDVRRARGEAAYLDVHGVPAPPARRRSAAVGTSTTSTARCGPATGTSPGETVASSASAAAARSASTRRPSEHLRAALANGRA